MALSVSCAGHTRTQSHACTVKQCTYFDAFYVIDIRTESACVPNGAHCLCHLACCVCTYICMHIWQLQVITPKKGHLFAALKEHCPVLFENYWPTPWGYNTHINSIFRAKFQRGVQRVKYTRYCIVHTKCMWVCMHAQTHFSLYMLFLRVDVSRVLCNWDDCAMPDSG